MEVKTLWVSLLVPRWEVIGSLVLFAFFTRLDVVAAAVVPAPPFLAVERVRFIARSLCDPTNRLLWWVGDY